MQAPTQPEKITRALSKAGIIQQITERSTVLTESAITVLERRYLAKDQEGKVLEDADGMFRRVARDLSMADLEYGAGEEERRTTEDKFYRAMRTLEVLPNSPTLMNAGRDLQQLSACFVLPIDDTLDSIFEKVKQTALIHKSGGGTGFSFSRLRPSGDKVGSTGGVASGPVSFIRTFDTATDVVKQGGTRRGANMAILNVDHPDIMAFIESKKDKASLQNFNISIAVTSEFMERAKRGEDYDLVNPRTGKITGQLNARRVFEKATELAWETGDPGLVFLDRINQDNPNPQLGKIESTNPCFAGEVRLATDHGLLTFNDLYLDQPDISVLTDNRAATLQASISGGNTDVATLCEAGVTLRRAVPVFLTRTNWPVFKLETDLGFEVIATEDHKFFTPEGPKALHEINPGDEVLIQSGKGVWSQDDLLPEFDTSNKLRSRLPKKWSRELGEMLGWVTSNGWTGHETPEHRRTPNAPTDLVSSNEEKDTLAHKFQTLIKQWLGTDGPSIERDADLPLGEESSLNDFLKSLGVDIENEPSKNVPHSIWRAPRETVLGFLSALFTADGTLNARSHNAPCAVRLANNSKKLLNEVQLLLINEGIVSKLHHPSESNEKSMSSSRGHHELVIDGQSRDRFLSEIGFLAPSKQDKAAAFLQAAQPLSSQDPFTDRIRSITFCRYADVYCTTEPETHTIVANGLVAAQCGEQPLLPYESCNLASINLARMVRYENGRPQIDWDALERTITTTVHMLDNVVDRNTYPVPEIEEMSKKTRRIGLGVMGFADMLIQMGVKYDSNEALNIAEDLMARIQRTTLDASSGLAIARGAFPAWEESIYNIQDSEERPRLIRNSAPTTIAPTGTISIIAGASSGIEPLFALSYVRNVMDNTRMVEGYPYFEAVARSEGFYSEELMNELARTGTLQGLDSKFQVPDWVKGIFRTSHDIDPGWHVRMQATFQAHTDNAVSKTINFPEDATVDDVAQAYMAAYDLNCKGITVYRDGSKANQVLSTGQGAEQEKEHQEHRAVRSRPQTVSGITERVRTGHGNMYVTLNFDEEDNPFEVFGNQGKAGGCDSAQLEAVSRLASLAMRSGIDPEAIVEQLRGITCCPAWDGGIQVKSGPDAVALAIARHIGIQRDQPTAGGTSQRGKCPDCGDNLTIQEGCIKCVSQTCGWSKCE